MKGSWGINERGFRQPSVSTGCQVLGDPPSPRLEGQEKEGVLQCPRPRALLTKLGA